MKKRTAEQQAAAIDANVTDYYHDRIDAYEFNARQVKHWRAIKRAGNIAAVQTIFQQGSWGDRLALFAKRISGISEATN